MRDDVYLNKPPLFFWTVALFALPFHAVTDANAPIASIVSALVGLLAVFAIGRLLWGAAVGLASALVLATSPFYFFMAHKVLDRHDADGLDELGPLFLSRRPARA